jgi:exopolysaccharide biosynthesis polyprenyl glycosylphosphotransferase
MRLRAYLVIVDAIAFSTIWIVMLPDYPRYGLVWLVFSSATSGVLWLAVHGMYRPAERSRRALETAQLFEVAVVLAVVAHFVDDYLNLGIDWRREVVSGVLAAAVAQTVRTVMDGPILRPRANRYQRRTLVAGRGGSVDALSARLASEPGFGHSVVARIDSVDVHEVVSRAHAAGVDTVMLAAEGPDRLDLAKLVRGVTNAGFDIDLVGGMTLVHPRRVHSVPFGHDMALRVRAVSLSRWQLWTKRPFDVAASTVLLVLLWPLMLVAMAAVKVSDGGPVLFHQERVGRDGRRFRMLKIRTMVIDAEARLPALASANQRSGPLFKLADDPRVTRVGRLLRAASVDELPQLWNVIRGEMSLVGPRPALPSEVAAFAPDLLRRHTVPPGITGLWQVEARDLADFRAYEDSDLFYVENWSVALDLAILLRTAVAVGGRILRAARSSPDIVLE